MSVYRFSGQEETDKPSIKDKIMEHVIKCIDLFCVWDCCWLWVKFQTFMALIVFDPFMELFITLCIVVNTAFMAADHHDMNPGLASALQYGNYVSNIYTSKNLCFLEMKIFFKVYFHF